MNSRLVSDRLVAAARRAMRAAYAPYSGFRVGAAVLAVPAGGRRSVGRIFRGCNVENASYGLTVCAERAAVLAAVSAGCSHIAAVAVASDGSAGPAVPCGACLQVLAEFCAPTCPVFLAPGCGPDSVRRFLLRQLLPRAFKLK